MDINDLKLFARAAELGNITHAAAELGYTQSAASHALRRLEQNLGTQLLQRLHEGRVIDGRGAVDDGVVMVEHQTLVAHARRLLCLTLHSILPRTPAKCHRRAQKRPDEVFPRPGGCRCAHCRQKLPAAVDAPAPQSSTRSTPMSARCAG